MEEDPPNSLKREEVTNNDLGRRSPWWGRRKEAANTKTPLQTWMDAHLIQPAVGSSSLLIKLSLEVSLIQASTTNEVTMWQRGGPHCLCIVEGQCSASPVIWTWEGEAKERVSNERESFIMLLVLFVLFSGYIVSA